MTSKITKTANGHKLEISKEDWLKVANKAGWTTAQFFAPTGGNDAGENLIDELHKITSSIIQNLNIFEQSIAKHKQNSENLASLGQQVQQIANKLLQG